MIENVPFFAQEAYQCGPASLAGVLNYWGVAVSPDEIAREIYSESARGTLDVDMIFYTQRKGLGAAHYQGSLEDAKKNINMGRPLIILVDEGFWVYQQNHFMVVIGYNEEAIIANSGKDQLKVISQRELARTWKRTGFWTLLITP
jgi:ABC-type bacteriocin/lantibiotic exporter with double-glycine peptidase domain